MVEHSLLLSHGDETPLGHIEVVGLLKGPEPVRRHRSMRILGSYALVYLFEGGGFYRDANGHSRRVLAGDLLILFPDLAHAYGPEAGDLWSELYFVFSGPVFDLWREAGLLDASRPIHHCEPVEHWLNRLRSTVVESAAPNRAASVLELTHFVGVLTEIIVADRLEEDPVREPLWLEAARRLLEADLGSELDMRTVAEEVGMSYESFRKQFSQHVGSSPSRYRSEKRISAASSLLRTTQMTNEQIARTLGFKDPFHFSKRFKQIAGISPRAYRHG